MGDSKQKLSQLTVLLHWLVAITVIVMLAVGIYMEENEIRSLVSTHKSVGILIFGVILLRVVWRLYNGWPEPVSQYSKIEQNLSRACHYVLITGTVLMPLSGMAMSGAGGHGLIVFGVELLAQNTDPVTGKAIPLNASIAKLGHESHGVIGYIMILALLLHIAGAFKHHLIDKDGTLKRMLGKTVSTQ